MAQIAHEKPRIRRRIATNIFVAICVLFVAISGGAANAATLYFSPQSGSFKTNDNIAVNIMVSSADQVINAASGVIDFPADKLQVSSLSKTGSIFSLWVQEPSFSNSTGIVNFEGIVLNPGFIGIGGKVFTVNFKAKSAGAATVSFASGSVLANDGKGTNILATLGTAQFNLSSPTPSEQAPEPTTNTPSAVSGTPLAPKISSLTNPDPDKWYNNPNPQFTWVLPQGITAVRLSIGKNSQGTPSVVYDPPISSKKIEELTDGIWYFSAQFKNNFGWGKISRFKIQIDTKPPEPFKIKIVDGEQTNNPRPVILFDTVDELSGIDFYKLKIGDGDFIAFAENKIKENPYSLPLQSPGKKTILVQAFDKAGNFSSASAELEITALNPPIITEFPEKLLTNEILLVKGETQYPKAQIILWLQKANELPKKQTVEASQEGKFSFVYPEKLSEGAYSFWAEQADERGAKSEPAPKKYLIVSQDRLLKIGSQAIQYLSIIAVLIACLLALAAMFLYGWSRVRKWKRKLKKETADVSLVLKDSFDEIRNTMIKQIKTLEEAKTKRELTKEEENIIKKMNQVLVQAEKAINKEVNDINKKID